MIFATRAKHKSPDNSSSSSKKNKNGNIKKCNNNKNANRKNNNNNKKNSDNKLPPKPVIKNTRNKLKSNKITMEQEIEIQKNLNAFSSFDEISNQIKEILGSNYEYK